MAPFPAGSRFLRSLLSALLSLFVAACGAEEEGSLPIIEEPPIEFPLTADSLNLDHGARQAWYESGWLADAMNTQAPRGMDLPSAPAFAAARWATDLAHLPARMERPALVFGSECTPVITGYNGAGLLIDSDGDGIPNDYKVDYGAACVSEIDGGVVRLTISGSRRLQDTNVGFRSFRVTTKDLVIVVEYLDTHVVHTIGLSGVEEGSFTPTAAHYAQTSINREHSFDPKAGIDDDRYRRIEEVGEFSPATGLSLSLDAPLPAGTLTYQADLGHMDPVDPLLDGRLFYHFTMAATTVLQYAPSCHGGDFVGGVLRGKLNDGEEAWFQLTWNGCTELPARELFGY